MPGPQGVPSFLAEAGDRAVDGALGNAEAEPLEHPRAEPVEDDVCAIAQLQCLREPVSLEIEVDDLLAAVDGLVPGRRAVAHLLTAGRLDLHDPRPEPHELAARVRPWQLRREVDDEVAGERLHPPRPYHYATAVD